MKTMMTILFLMTSMTTFASDSQENIKGKNFEENKAKMLDHMSKRISALNTAKSCISSATNKEEVKKCRAPLKEMNKEFRSKRKEWKEKRRQRRGQGN